MKTGHIIVGGLVALAVLVLIVALMPTSPTEPVSEEPVALATPKSKPTPLPSQRESEEQPPAISVMPPESDPTHDDKVHDRVQELLTLAMNDDTASLNTIWAELSNPDKEIRAGALEAVVQFGDRSKEKALRTMAEDIEDAEEKARFVAAADFLALPPLPIPGLPSSTGSLTTEKPQEE